MMKKTRFDLIRNGCLIAPVIAWLIGQSPTASLASGDQPRRTDDRGRSADS